MKKVIKLIIVILILSIIGIKDIKAEEIPKIFLTGDISDMKDKNDERKVKLRYISNDLEFTSHIKIKLQGNSSLRYDKKNYTFKLYTNNNYDTKEDIDFGWGPQHKYHLKANWIDKTHSRNIVTANIIASIQDKYNLFTETPNNGEIDGFPTEVYVNDNFLGLYTLNIPKDNWTYNMDNDNPNHIVFVANVSNDSTMFHEEANYKNWELEVGTEDDETLEKFNKLITFINDSTDQEFKENFSKHLNLDATLNYYCILNYAKLTDNMSKNLLLATYDGKIWYPVLYDLDTSWGTNWQGNTSTNYTTDLTEPLNKNELWKKLQKNFPNEIANRYFELRKDILNKQNILKKFNNFYKKIPNETLNKEQKKWQDIPGYDFNQIEDFIDTRTPYIDKQIYNLYDSIPSISLEYSTKKFTLKPVTVTIKTNRNDIIIIKNNKQTYDYKLTFTKNGEYTYEYQDWYGNYIGTITITINNIYTQILKNILIGALVIFIGLILFITGKKKKQETTNSTIKKQKSKKEQIQPKEQKTNNKTVSNTNNNDKSKKEKTKKSSSSNTKKKTNKSTKQQKATKKTKNNQKK